MNTWRAEIKMGFDEEQTGNVGDPFLSSEGLGDLRCSVLSLSKRQGSWERSSIHRIRGGGAEQVAGYLLGPHGTLRNQLGKLGLSASRLVVLIKGWAGERWEIAPGSSLAGGRQVFLSRCFWALWALPPPASWESCSVRVSDHFLSFSPQFLTWHLLKWVISWSVIILITSGVSVGRFALSNSTVFFCSSYQ